MRPLSMHLKVRSVSFLPLEKFSDGRGKDLDDLPSSSFCYRRRSRSSPLDAGGDPHKQEEGPVAPTAHSLHYVLFQFRG